MAEQDVPIEPGKGKLVYDKQRRTIVATGGPTATTGITSEERSKSEWPTRGPEFNAWHENVELFAQIIQQNPGLWLKDADLKYLNLRIDTRSGHFLVTCRDGEAISADRVVNAARAARNNGLNRAYADVSKREPR